MTKNLDFVKRILIVTERPQAPTWLKTDFRDDSVDISLIFHDQVQKTKILIHFRRPQAIAINVL